MTRTSAAFGVVAAFGIVTAALTGTAAANEPTPVPPATTAPPAAAAPDTTTAPAAPGKTVATPKLLSATNATPNAATIATTRCYGNVNDGDVVPWYGAPVTVQQPVAVSAVQKGGGTDEFFGDAHVYSEGVAVHQGEVDVRVHTGWKDQLDVCLHYVG